MQALDTLGVPLSAFLAVAVILYVIGIYGMATKRNMIKFLISLELLLDGAHLNFIAFAAIWTGNASVQASVRQYTPIPWLIRSRMFSWPMRRTGKIN